MRRSCWLILALSLTGAGCASRVRAEEAQPPAGDQPRQTLSLHEAARQGDLAEVKANLDRGSSPDARNEDGNTPLGMAVMNGRREVVELLLERGADVNVRGIKSCRDSRFLGGWTALHGAAAEGHREIAEILIKRGADVNAGDVLLGIGLKPLHLTAYHGHAEVVELLLAKGAHVNARGPGGTPLHEAVSKGHKKIVELLLAKGADVAAKDKEGYTPLNRSMFLMDKSISRLLLDKGRNWTSSRR